MLIFVYGCGLALSTRLSRRIVAVIDALSHAALQVGKGGFAVRVAVPQQHQLGVLGSSFNEMTRDLENLREQERQKAILEREIALAHEVQQYLYPRSTSVLSRAKVNGITVPARLVSGDLYEFLSFDDSQFGLLCADISGKGISAALVMAHLQVLVYRRLLASQESNLRPDPGARVTALNRDFRDRIGENRYATMVYGEFDTRTNIFRCVNAGHCPPILIPYGAEPIKLSGGDLPVGLFPDVSYNELRVALPSRSALILYTDGLTEALNSFGEELGDDRLMSYCASLPKDANAETICEFLSSKVVEWSYRIEQADDTTILVLTAS
jgi:serine phosphatase RsbU (regulator of sigma subunit)